MLRGPFPTLPKVFLQQSVVNRPRNAGSRLRGAKVAEQLKIWVAGRAAWVTWRLRPPPSPPLRKK